MYNSNDPNRHNDSEDPNYPAHPSTAERVGDGRQNSNSAYVGGRQNSNSNGGGRQNSNSNGGGRQNSNSNGGGRQNSNPSTTQQLQNNHNGGNSDGGFLFPQNPFMLNNNNSNANPQNDENNNNSSANPSPINYSQAPVLPLPVHQPEEEFIPVEFPEFKELPMVQYNPREIQRGTALRFYLSFLFVCLFLLVALYV
jgi:hypothetical protein